MDARGVLAVVHACAAQGTDAFGLAVAVAAACNEERDEVVEVLRAIVDGEPHGMAMAVLILGREP
jgi:hypothetical protein